MKQPERSNENLSWSKVNARRLNIDRTARLYAALAALLFVFVFSLSNATGASGPQTKQPNARQGEVVLDGIRYSPITNDKGRTIYVPTIATPEYIAKIIEQYKDVIQHNVNEHSNKEPKIEELAIEPNLEQKLTAYLFLAAENDGNAAPKTLEEMDELGKELGYPLLRTYDNFKIEEIDGKSYLVPIKENDKRTAYLVGITIDKPKRGHVCDAEYAIVIEQYPEGKRILETETKENKLGYTRRTELFINTWGLDKAGRASYTILEPLKPIEERIIIHGCVIKDKENPKQATTYLSAPIYRTFSDYANNN